MNSFLWNIFRFLPLHKWEGIWITLWIDEREYDQFYGTKHIWPHVNTCIFLKARKKRKILAPKNLPKTAKAFISATRRPNLLNIYESYICIKIYFCPHFICNIIKKKRMSIGTHNSTWDLLGVKSLEENEKGGKEVIWKYI